MTTTTDTQQDEVPCLACGHPVFSEASRARRIGSGCYRKLRAAFRTADLSQWTPAQVAETMQAVEDGAVVPSNREGVFHVVSTDGTEVHLVHRDGCNCTNGLQNKPPRPCWHRCAVTIITAAVARPARNQMMKVA
jgi:hypothetical protein